MGATTAVNRRVRRAARRGLLSMPPGARRRVELGLLRGYEAGLRLRSREAAEVLDDGGRPVPPARLRVLVSGTADVDFFLDTGRRQAALFRAMVERHGGRLEDMGAVLDFGVGCGRIARHWADLGGPQVFGCDPNRDLVRWCRENLPHVNAATSEDGPPLPYGDGGFDLVYALSIFTHLPEPSARAWMAELRRVLRPGGLLLLTTAGAAYRERLEPGDRARYDRDEEVVQFDSASGTNLCIAYHSPGYVRTRMLDGFELLEAFVTPEHPDEAGAARIAQDVYLARAAASEA